MRDRLLGQPVLSPSQPGKGLGSGGLELARADLLTPSVQSTEHHAPRSLSETGQLEDL